MGNGSAARDCGFGDDVEALRREKAELQNQLERRAQIVVQLRQKNLNASCESGSVRLGPDSAVDERSLLERVRYLEVENSKQSEQIRLYRGQEFRLNNNRPVSGGRCNSDDEGSTEFCPQDGGYDEAGYDDELEVGYAVRGH